MAYATVDDLAGYVTPPANATVLLDRATRIVDQALKSAVYDVDDTDIQAALRTAVCEQVAWQLEGGDDTGTGAAAAYSTVTAGAISFTRTPGAGGSSAGGALAPQARMVLDQAGLLGHSPWVC